MPSLSQEQKEDILSKKAQGLSIREIARQVLEQESRESTIRRYLKSVEGESVGFVEEALVELLDGIEFCKKVNQTSTNLPKLDSDIHKPIKQSNVTGKTILVIGDLQIKPNVSLDYCKAIGNYIASKKPDIIVNIGDSADLPSLSSYDRGKTKFEGRRLVDDIKAAREGLGLISDAFKDIEGYNPEMHLTLGNHCLEFSTEVLTNEGWIKAGELVHRSLGAYKIASVNLKNNELSYNSPLDSFVVPDQEIWSVTSKKGNYKNEVVSAGHSIIFKGERKVVSDLEGEVKFKDLHVPIKASEEVYVKPAFLTNDLIRLITWVVTDGCLYQDKKYLKKKRVQFKLSKPRKITALRELLGRLGIKYTFKEATKSDINKMQPYFVRMYGDEGRYIWDILEGVKKFPEYFKSLNKEQCEAFLETLLITDGYNHDGSLKLTTTVEEDAKLVQEVLFSNGYTVCYSEKDSSYSGFPNGKKQYHLTCPLDLDLVNSSINKVVIKNEGFRADVYGFTTRHSTLVTRRSGAISVTGNCHRLDRFAEDHQELEGFLGVKQLGLEDFGYTVHPFLKPVEIEGILFCHYFPNEFTGKPLGGNANSMLGKIRQSFVAGHKQTLDIAISHSFGGKQQIGIVNGACYDHAEDYKGHIHNSHFRGLVVLHEVKDGFGLPLVVSLDYLKDNYL